MDRRRVMRSTLIYILLACAACFVFAQTVELVAPSTLQVTDDIYDVTFRFPARWKFSERSNFYSPLSISVADWPVRGVIFTKRLAGVLSWPVTDFEGAEFGYAARKVASPDTCKNLALIASRGDNSAISQRTLHGIVWNHGSGGEGGAGHIIDEDIYTVLTDSAGGACLVFDLATQSLEAGGSNGRNPRQMTRQEKVAVNRELQVILSSVRLIAPLRPSASNKHP
jgi:hypothetical protein